MDNPYQSPSANLSKNELFGTADGKVPPGVIHQLAGTKGWVRFMSVLAFIGAGFMVLSGIGMVAAGSEMQRQGLPFPAAAMGVMYIVFAFLYIYPAMKLGSYASEIGRLIFSGNVGDLESALNQQRAFWKFTGIMTILMFVLMIVMIVAVVALGAAAMA